MSAVCSISGVIIDSQGQPMPGVAVRAAIVSPRNAPIFSTDGELVAQASVEVETDDNGAWSMALIQGISAIVTIDVIGFARQIVVPSTSSALLKDLV